jgi:hypothetical protein
MDKTAIAQEKIEAALKRFSAEHKCNVEDLRICIRVNQQSTNLLVYDLLQLHKEENKLVYLKALKLSDFLHLSGIEKAFVKEIDIINNIFSTLRKFAIGALCSRKSLSVMLYQVNEYIQPCLYKEGKFYSDEIIGDDGQKQKIKLSDVI